jgi:hypothetical protein
MTKRKWTKDHPSAYKYQRKQYKGYTLKKFADGSTSIHGPNGRYITQFTKGGFRRCMKYIDR